MGFLKFLKKKPTASSDTLDMPMPPPKFESGQETSLPTFPEEVHAEDLKLPEIPELETGSLDTPNIPDFPETPEMKAEPFSELNMPKREIPKFEIPKNNTQLPRERPDDVYKHTPAKTANRLFLPKETEIHHANGEVYIKGEDYRDLIEGLDAVILKQKEMLGKPEKDIFKIEEREHDRFILSVEDLQRNLILTEGTIFE